MKGCNETPSRSQYGSKSFNAFACVSGSASEYDGPEHVMASTVTKTGPAKVFLMLSYVEAMELDILRPLRGLISHQEIRLDPDREVIGVEELDHPAHVPRVCGLHLGRVEVPAAPGGGKRHVHVLAPVGSEVAPERVHGVQRKEKPVALPLVCDPSVENSLNSSGNGLPSRASCQGMPSSKCSETMSPLFRIS